MVNEKIFDLLNDTLQRLYNVRRKEEFPHGQVIELSPFYTSVFLSENEEFQLDIKNGDTRERNDTHGPLYRGLITSRMGDPLKGGGVAHTQFQLGKGLYPKSVNTELERAANRNYWNCVDDYLERFTKARGKRKKRDYYLYFSKEKIEDQEFIDKEKDYSPDIEGLEKRFQQATERFRPEPGKTTYNTGEIAGSEINFSIIRENRYFVDSDGRRRFQSFAWWEVFFVLGAPDDKGLVATNYKVFRGLHETQIPSLELLTKTGYQLESELRDIAISEIQKNGFYPCWCDNEVHGVNWHESYGHQGEAERMQKNKWGEVSTLFKDRIGEHVAPDFLSFYDDPTLPGLLGSYNFDDEGIRAQRVPIIEDGILRNYLHSRQSAGYFNTHSNGHSRGITNEIPQPRMSNIIIKSTKELTQERLFQEFLAEIERQERPYGLLLQRTGGGFTLTDDVFLNSDVVHVFRVDKNGKRERKRGIYVAATSSQPIENIMFTGDEYRTRFGKCGAESGVIPTSETAPDALFRNLEVDRIPEDSFEDIDEWVLD